MFFQIFIPGARGADIENLRKVGLDDLLSPNDIKPEVSEIMHGPTGGHGQLWGWTDNADPALSWNSDRHTSIPCVADPERNLPAGRFHWIFKQGEKPSETILRRPDTFTGFNAKLSDDREWLIPNVMELPQSFGFAETGEIIKGAKPEWKPFVDDAEWALNQFLEGAGAVRDWKRELSVAIRFLAVNYRINRELVVRFGLITPENVFDVIVRGIDRSRLSSLIESVKNPEAGAATPAGSSA